jgi:endonuclease YncB( thermonuclease family)
MKVAFKLMVAIGLGIAVASSKAEAQEPAVPVTGPARAVNADTLQVGQTYVFLYGVESVERTQRCTIDGIPWECYAAAVRALENIIGVADVTCELTGEPDYLGRWLGTCSVAGANVAEALTRAGFALAKRDETLDYVAAEEAAQAEAIGLWQGEFQHPAEHRAAEGILLDRP